MNLRRILKQYPPFTTAPGINTGLAATNSPADDSLSDPLLLEFVGNRDEYEPTLDS